MSWVFALLLCIYACFRCVGWTQGQLRWRALRHTAPQPRPARSIDAGAPDATRRVHGELNDLRAALATHELEVRKAAATDPDAMFGMVRSSRYRVAVRRMSWTLNAWLDAHREGNEGLRADCDALDRVQLAAFLAAVATPVCSGLTAIPSMRQ